MKNLGIAVILLSILVGCDQKKSKNENEHSFVIGKADSLHSAILNEGRKFFVYLPPTYGDGSDTTKRYPVVYLLDGGSHFHSVTGLLDQLTSNELVPEMIVVAITNTDRSRDLTPTRSLKLPDGSEQEWLNTTGGADNFLRFIETELFPHVEKNYPTEPHRILIGHSFGGLFTIHTMMNRPDLFNSYVAIDPSMWWDNRKLLMQSDTFLREKNFNRKTLFVSVANTMPGGMDTLRVASDTTGNTSHIRSIIQFSKQASVAKKTNGMNFSWKYYGEDSHGSVPLITAYDALRYIFGYYRMAYDPAETAETYINHYKIISDKLGYTKLPPENAMNDKGYGYLSQKKFEQAMSFFNVNLKNYPASANAHDSMGDYYLAVGDTTNAKALFMKSLAIKDIASTRKKLEEIQK
jgi:uncharacterized protein